MAEDLVPYAYEYGKSNGDGTYSVVIERPPLRSQVADRPAKPLYAADLIEQQAASLAAKDKEIADLRTVLTDPAAFHLHALRNNILSRMNALHLAGATDYDALKTRAEQAERALALIYGGLEMLLAATHANDQKREILVRVGDLMRIAQPTRAFIAQHGSDSKGDHPAQEPTCK